MDGADSSSGNSDSGNNSKKDKRYNKKGEREEDLKFLLIKLSKSNILKSLIKRL